MSDNTTIAPQRIGSGVGYFIFGIIALFIGGLAAMGGGLRDIGTAGFFTTMGAGLIAVGFWVSLFGKLEMRLMDMQRLLAPQAPKPAPQADEYKDDPTFGKF